MDVIWRGASVGNALEDYIEVNKRQQTHHTHTKYTIYIE